jgi:hypothetical protein
MELIQLTQNITVDVTVNDNDSKLITSLTLLVQHENQTAIGTVTATDADGDSCNFHLFQDLK